MGSRHNPLEAPLAVLVSGAFAFSDLRKELHMFITNQPYPDIAHRTSRRTHLPTFHRSNPYIGGFHADLA